MSKGSGGSGGSSGKGVGKTGEWIKVKDGRKSISIIFNPAETIEGNKYYPFGGRWQQSSKHGSFSGLFRPKDGEVFNNKFDVLHNHPIFKNSDTSKWVSMASHFR